MPEGDQALLVTPFTVLTCTSYSVPVLSPVMMRERLAPTSNSCVQDAPLLSSRYWMSWLSADGADQDTPRLVADAGETRGAQGGSPAVRHSSVTLMVTVMVAV